MGPENPAIAKEWHALSGETALELLGSGSGGLAEDEAKKRLAVFGPNELQAAVPVSPWILLFQQFKNVLIVILLISALISAFVGHEVEAAAIAVIVLFAALFGFAQEYRAERALEALKEMAAPEASLLRGGEEMKIAARDLVPGDVVLLRSGDRVPADMRLIESYNLRIEESALTGESVAVEKDDDTLLPSGAPPAERCNMAFAGTSVAYGRGSGVVVATGMATEFGRIAGMISTIEPGRTPLQENLDRVGKVLVKIAFAGVAVVVVAGLLRGEPLVSMLLFGVALGVAVVPEALPAVVTISLAIGVQRMVKRHALMRKLAAVETLGSTTVICSDKTGTLTRDEMTVRNCLAAGERFGITGAGYEPEGGFEKDGVSVEPSRALKLLLKGAALASDADLVREASGRWGVRGDATEGALLAAAAKAGLYKDGLEKAFPRVDEIPFTSERKQMTTIHPSNGGMVAFSKGAPEVILAGCSGTLTADGEALLDEGGRERILAAARSMGEAALRVLAVSCKEDATRESAETETTFLGLIGMIDPPRSEAQAAIRTCVDAGIRVVMITGDHPVTACAIADELGLSAKGRTVTGGDIEAMDQPALEREVAAIQVYARVSPAHKLRIVEALQKRGEVVAMTGDGVNDAPALKKADIGIAMGITGTAVSKEAAAMTLTDDNFASIVAAVEEGRGIFDNIKKYLMYLLSSNMGEIGLMAGALLLGLPLPLSAVQILYVNLATDGLPALALAVDPAEKNIMHKPPRDPSKGIFTRPVVMLILVGGAWSTLANLALFTWARRTCSCVEEAMTMTFVSLVLIQFFKAYNFRSDRDSVLRTPFANKWLNLAVLWELFMLAVIVYLPLLHKPFGTYALTMHDWFVIVAVSGTIFPVLEAAKWLERRGVFAPSPSGRGEG